MSDDVPRQPPRGRGSRGALMFQALLSASRQPRPTHPGPGQPHLGPGQPQPGPGQPYPGPGQPQPGPGQPQPGPGQPQPRPGQPQSGPGQPYPGSGQPQPGPGQPQPRPGQPYPGPGQSHLGPGQLYPKPSHPPLVPSHPPPGPVQPYPGPGHPTLGPSQPPLVPNYPPPGPGQPPLRPGHPLPGPSQPGPQHLEHEQPSQPSLQPAPSVQSQGRGLSILAARGIGAFRGRGRGRGCGFFQPLATSQQQQGDMSEPGQIDTKPRQRYVSEPMKGYVSEPKPLDMKESRQRLMSEPKQQYQRSPREQYVSESKQTYEPRQQDTSEPRQTYEPRQQDTSEPRQQYKSESGRKVSEAEEKAGDGHKQDVQDVPVSGVVSPPSSQTSSQSSLFMQMMQRRARLSPSATPISPGTTVPPREKSAQVEAKLSLARGRSELLHAHDVGSKTIQPGAKPLKADSQELSDQSTSVTESLQHIALGDGQEREIVSRPGSTGIKFSAMTNWIRLTLEDNKAVFEYEVKFEPEVDAVNLRYRLISKFQEQLGNVKSFDGVILWLPIRLPKEITIFHTTHPLTEETLTLKIMYKKRTEMARSVQLYNVLFNRIMRVLRMARVGRNYYNPGESILVPQHKLEIWPGYVTAASYQEGGLMLVTDVSHKILRTETCYDSLADLCRMHPGNFKQMAIQALVGCIVLTRYNNRTYRIDDILFDQNASSTFTNFKDEEIKYIDYYSETYDITIQDPKQPLLLHRVKKRDLQNEKQTRLLCLIPELCYMTGLTDNMRADFRVMKDVAHHTRITPTVRQAALRKYISSVNGNPEARKLLESWGLRLEDNTLGLEGRVLPPENIVFGNKEVPGSQHADWGREACREKVIQPVDLKPRSWLIMFSARDQPRAQRFADMMKQVTGGMGIRVGDAQMVRLPDDRTETYVNTLKQYHNDQLQMAVIIFPTQREDRYSAVKRLACSELALPTQCIISRTISQDHKLRSVTQKIALQINCKLGGELWAVKIPLNGVMVCGVDVYHDPSRRGSSVVGFVASSNQMLTRWFSRVSFQHVADEVVHGLKISLLEALRHYHRVHHSLPRSIIVYRDGVGDGQIKIVEDHEVPQLATIFLHFDSYEPKLSLVVVQKRLNTRIFATMSSRGLDNPPPGAIVDHTITRPYWYDFLLVSQHVRQGTVSPTHYIVVRDGGNLKADNMQRLTYKLTHLYYNWPGTVRVPAPCMYAHKLAYLIGQSVRKDPATVLCDKLFFL